MARKVEITKEKILEVGFEMLKEFGMEYISARNIAKELNCSTQPIFFCFKNMDDLKNQLLDKARTIYSNYILKTMDDVPRYMATGLGYVSFAREEKELFKLLFMSKNIATIDGVPEEESELNYIYKVIMEQTNLRLEIVKKYHFQMWVFTHGLAVLIATDAIYLTDDEIKKNLTNQYIALNRRWKDE